MSDKEGANEDYFNPEEEVKITSEVECTLPKEKVSSGEEDEECIYKGRIRLFRCILIFLLIIFVIFDMFIVLWYNDINIYSVCDLYI